MHAFETMNLQTKIHTSPWKRVAALALSLLVTIIATVTIMTTPADAVRPPGIPSLSVAQSQLNALNIQSESHSSSYSRSLFPHWVNVEGNCTARQYVLSRDGFDVEVNSSCQPTSGLWQSDFDSTWSTCVSCSTIDHVVALKEAWESGAWAWSTTERRAFANDVNSPQLWIASSSINSSKGYKDPAEWTPPTTSVRCDYAKAWINVKYLYDLDIDSSEKSALQAQLNNYC